MALAPRVPGAINVAAPLTGREIVAIAGLGPTSQQTTTAAIAALADLDSTNQIVTSLTTVGAGTVTAAAVIGQNLQRTGTQSAAFTDTTAIATAIIAALPAGAPVGTSFEFMYDNGTTGAGGYPATLQGGTGVTVSGTTVIRPRSWVRYIVTVATSTTVTMKSVGSGFHTTAQATFNLNGATPVTVADAHVTPSSSIAISLNTVGGTVGVYPHIATITPGTGFTVVGTASDTSTYSYVILG